MDPYIILSGQSKGVNRNKRNRYKSLILAIVKQINQKQLILVQGVDSKKGQLIYLTRKGSFQVILYKMIRFLSGKLKKHTKLAKIVKISIFVNRLVFPMNFNQFNRFSHPMTIIYDQICCKINSFLSQGLLGLCCSIETRDRIERITLTAVLFD